MELTSCCSAKAGHACELGDGLAVHAEAVGAAEAVGVEAEEGPALDAGVAVAAGGDEGDDNAVAGLDVGDVVADFLDDAGGLVTEDGRARHGVLALHEVEVGVADAGGAGADEDLVGAGLVDIDIFDDEGLVDAVHDCSLHSGLLWITQNRPEYGAWQGRTLTQDGQHCSGHWGECQRPICHNLNIGTGKCTHGVWSELRARR